LAGEQIPLVGRIVAVADVFDALTSVRPYKQAWSWTRRATSCSTTAAAISIRAACRRCWALGRRRSIRDRLDDSPLRATRPAA
jgi:hypothetical protein